MAKIRISPPAHRGAELQAWLLSAFLATATVFVADRLLGGLQTGSRPWPGFSVLALSWGGHAVAVVATGLPTLLAVELDRAWQAGRWGEKTPSGVLAAIACGLAVLYPLGWLGGVLVAGDWISQQAFAWVLRPLPAVLGVAGIAGLVWVFMRSNSRSLTSALWALFVAVTVTDAVFMPGHYPELHLALYGLAAWTATLAWQQTLRGRVPAWPIRRLKVATIVAAVLLATAGWGWLGMRQDQRSEVMLDSSRAATVLQHAAAVEPGNYVLPLIEGSAVADPKSSRDALEPAHRFRAPGTWNVVLVTVDTLRADTLPPARGPGQEHASSADTPFLNRFVAESFVFTRAYAQASMTHKSLPPTFRSLQPFEDSQRIGKPLAEEMWRTGRVPVAVVNNFFLEPRFEGIQGLLDGFHRVEVYEKRNMSRQHDLTARLLNSVADRPFFAWLHYYCMHVPGNIGRPLYLREGPWVERYRMSLQWLDQQLEMLMEELESVGVRDRTIVVVTADHGEGLGDNGVKYHGTSVFEEEIRVPFIVHIPGFAGREIDATIGNIDLVPTLIELMGGSPRRTHRGYSLVPLMMNEGLDWNRTYYMQNAKGTQVAVVRAADKLVYDIKADVLYLFDLDADPAEDENLYTTRPSTARELLTRLVRIHPRLFRENLEQESTRSVLEQRLLAVDPSKPPEDLPFLLELAASSPTPTLQSAAERLFLQATDDDSRLQVIEAMTPTDRRLWNRHVTEFLQRLGHGARELEFIDGLARQGQRVFAPEVVARHMAAWIRGGDPSTWRPWLALIDAWSPLDEAFVPALRDLLLQQTGSDSDVEMLVETLEAIGALEAGADVPEDLRQASRAWLGDARIPVRIAACEALARVGDRTDMGRLSEVLAAEDEELRVRQAALHALGGVGGEGAIPTLVAHGSHYSLTLDAVVALERIGSRRGLPFLEDVAKNYNNGIIQRRARKAISRITKPDANP